MNAFDPLIQLTEVTFAFVVEHGFNLMSREFISPDSFRGGFKLNYSNGQTILKVEYLEHQFVVRCNSMEIFGPSVHPGFGGNMFSSQHLIESLSGIAQSIRNSHQLIPSA